MKIEPAKAIRGHIAVPGDKSISHRALLLGAILLTTTGLLLVAVSLAAAGCSDDNTGPATPRMYNQVQRLGNPLVSEVLLSKRDHPTHGSIGPDQDASLVAPLVVDFLTTVAGRDPGYIQTIAPAAIASAARCCRSSSPTRRSAAYR